MNNISQVLKYGKLVYANETMDELRKKYCLCLNCSKMANCETAKVLREICIKNNMAMAITRCKEWEDKQ